MSLLIPSRAEQAERAAGLETKMMRRERALVAMKMYNDALDARDEGNKALWSKLWLAFSDYADAHNYTAEALARNCNRS